MNAFLYLVCSNAGEPKKIWPGVVTDLEIPDWADKMVLSAISI